MRDLHDDLSSVTSIRSQAVTATVNGTGAGCAGYNGATVLIDLGTFAGTTPSATIKVQESDDGSTYTDVAAADLVGGQLAAIDTTNDEALYERGYIGSKQYLRVAVTAISGTGPSLPMCAVVVRGYPRTKPAS